MRCDQCQHNEATIQMHIQINRRKEQLHLCTECYRKMKQRAQSSYGVTPFGGFSSMDDLFKGFGFTHPSMGAENKEQMAKQQKQQHHGLLDQLGRNLSHSAKAGLIDPVIGRDQEVNRVIEILNRRNKNNPVLIGEPGVGKTAIAEGLALKIAEGNVPSKLLKKEIYLLDVASLVADTGIRGQFEERMKQLMAELQARKNVILFIDEIHLVVGAGSAQGSMDAGNILKPALARGELQVIGATTLKEYRQIEKDAALERRFQPVIVQEPSLEQAIEIVKGLQSRYEDYHGVKYTDEAIRACVTLSHRYIQDRYLPDKAIDLMDEAGSKINLLLGADEELDIQERLDAIALEKEKAAKEENYERAAELRDEEIKLQQLLEEKSEADQADKIPSEPAQTEHESHNKAQVSVMDIQRIIEDKTGIPVRKLQLDEQSKIKDLESRLALKVIGQEEAVKKVSKAIRRSRAGLKSKNRPIGSFLFVGPTGVGKTELTKCLAEELFGTKEAMIRLDMSEYMEKHSISKIIGSPPGYVGHDEAGQLTEQVRRNPYSIILLDEIEKAHPDVQHMFLQILEDGRLTDSQGRTVSFKDTVIIMTSNAGTVDHKKAALGFVTATDQQAPQVQQSNILDSLGAYFKPEFLNRFDSIVQFNHLGQDHLLQIVDIMLHDLQTNLEEQGIDITFTEEVKVKIAKLGYHPAFGARPLRRVIQEELEDRVADLLLDEDDVSKLQVDLAEDQIIVKK
jgi:ATP-dependent Clp protease ATP-binding subunit ClpE